MKQCDWCGADFAPLRSNQRYCQPAHRKQAFNARRRAEAEGGSTEQSDGTGKAVSSVSVAAPTLAELQKLGVETTALGASALALAIRIDAWTAADPPAALARLVGEHANAMGRAKAAAAKSGSDPADELATRRERRRHNEGLA